MRDQTAAEFDELLVTALRAYADSPAVVFDPTSVARDAIAASRHQPGAVGFRWTWGRSRAFAVIATLLLLALLAALFAAGRRDSPIGDTFAAPVSISWSPDGSQLSFVVDVADHATGTDRNAMRSAHQELWVVAADGSGRHLLARLPSQPPVQQPLWSPDGRHLAYVTPAAGAASADLGSDLNVVGLDGAPARVVTTRPGGVTLVGWAPTGDRLAYNASDATGSDVFMASVDGRSAVQLTSTHEANASALSPDGTSILYVDGVVNGTKTSHSGTWVMHADGSAKVHLGACCDVGWSVNGARVYFEGETGPLLSAAADGTDVRPLVENHVPSGWTLSPDGAHYAVQTPTGIDVARLDAPAIHLTTDGRDDAPSWSPDGSWISFWGTRDLVTGLFVVSSDGGQPDSVGPDAFMESHPWQPSAAGRGRLAFVRDRAIFTISVDGSDQRELVSRATIAGVPREGATGVGAFQDRMIIGPDGPDRDIYRVAVGSSFRFKFENRTDAPRIVLLPGFDILSADCRVGDSGAIALAAFRRPISPVPVELATPPDFCLIPSHRVVAIDKAAGTLGPAQVKVTDAGGAYGTGYPVILDLEKANP